MKIALLALLGLALGALGGAALGIGAGLAWGALLFGVIAIRDAEIADERVPARGHDR